MNERCSTFPFKLPSSDDVGVDRDLGPGPLTADDGEVCSLLSPPIESLEASSQRRLGVVGRILS